MAAGRFAVQHPVPQMFDRPGPARAVVCSAGEPAPGAQPATGAQPAELTLVWRLNG
jgi:hypothetical protein